MRGLDRIRDEIKAREPLLSGALAPGKPVQCGNWEETDASPVVGIRQQSNRHSMRNDGHMDRGSEFDGVRIGRPAAGGLVDAGFVRLSDLPEDLDELRAIHGVGPKAIRLLGEARISPSQSLGDAPGQR